MQWTAVTSDTKIKVFIQSCECVGLNSKNYLLQNQWIMQNSLCFCNDWIAGFVCFSGHHHHTLLVSNVKEIGRQIYSEAKQETPHSKCISINSSARCVPEVEEVSNILHHVGTACVSHKFQSCCHLELLVYLKLIFSPNAVSLIWFLCSTLARKNKHRKSHIQNDIEFYGESVL
jgi:hypothetical protein